ncbi:MAG: M15 family metallopeptidase [Actinomycetota bacterium]|nr:M15 family metallopeptidase [Actinomycetota bacterium]
MRRRLRLSLAAGLALIVLGSGSSAPEPSVSGGSPPSGEGAANHQVTTVVLEADTPGPLAAAPPRARRPSPRPAARRRSTPPPPSPAPPAPPFQGSARSIDGATRSRMTSSWRPGCPVAIEDLRLLSVDHWGFDGRVHRGELVVHRDQAGRVLHVMGQLFEARFPIERMQLVDVYGGDDDRSMAANNTSAFNCRSVSGRAGVWSQHSYGWAVDINPVQNPYVSGGRVSPPAGAVYADRSLRRPGMIHAGDAVVRAFASIGWGWGGNWGSAKDYQHFSATGR